MNGIWSMPWLLFSGDVLYIPNLWDRQTNPWNHHEPNIYQNMGSDHYKLKTLRQTWACYLWLQLMTEEAFMCLYWPISSISGQVSLNSMGKSYFFPKKTSKSPFSPSFLHHFPMGKSWFSPKKCHPKKWMTVVHLTPFLKKIPSFTHLFLSDKKTSHFLTRLFIMANLKKSVQQKNSWLVCVYTYYI